MSSGTPRIRDVLLMRLPTHVPPGHEQQGLRPVVVVAEPKRAGRPRFEIVYGAPMTTQHNGWTEVDAALYPLLKKGVGGLVYDSAVLVEHARGIDAARAVRRLGRLTPDQYTPIRQLLEKMFAFEAPTP